MLEFAALIRSGKTTYDFNFQDSEERKRILDGDDEVTISKWCNECKSDCCSNFNGRILLVIGLNNSRHASMLPLIEYNYERDMYVNAQDFDALFKYMDDTMKIIFPKATGINKTSF